MVYVFEETNDRGFTINGKPAVILGRGPIQFYRQMEKDGGYIFITDKSEYVIEKDGIVYFDWNKGGLK